METKKIELKVTLKCEKCKTEYMKVVAKLQGVNEITVNADKGMIVVVGTVDPVCVVSQLRKAKKYAEVISFGPNKKPEAPTPKKPLASLPIPLPPCCKQCQLVGVSYSYDNGGCSIM